MARSRIASAVLPYPPLLGRLLRTTALIWLPLHAFLAIFLGILSLDFVAAMVMAGVCAAAVWFDLRRHSEHLFYANLGISPLWSAAVVLGTIGALELLLALGIRLLSDLR